MDHQPATTPCAYDELPRRGGVACSWGLWGDDDRFGTLNLLTEDRAREAAATVTRGSTFPLDWDMGLPDPPLFERQPWRHQVGGSPESTSQDDWLDDWNTQASSQWDGFRHVRRSGHGHYNGLPDLEHGVHHWARRGIVGRGVLADVATWRRSVGRPLAHGTPDPITPDDLTATLEAQGTAVEPGDVLLIRTGWIEWYTGLDARRRKEVATFEGLTTVGLEPSEEMAQTLWDLHVSAIAADNPALEVWPIGALMDPETVAEISRDLEREHERQLHTRLLPMLGMPIGELWHLDDLAADCRQDGRWHFLLTSAPIQLTAGVASPPNALAIK